MELICNTELVMTNSYDSNEVVQMLTVGEVYPVIKETSMLYTIVNDQGQQHSFSKQPDGDGISYATWLNPLEEDE